MMQNDSIYECFELEAWLWNKLNELVKAALTSIFNGVWSGGNVFSLPVHLKKILIFSKLFIFQDMIVRYFFSHLYGS